MKGKEFKEIRKKNKIKRNQVKTNLFSVDFIKYAETKNKKIPEILIKNLKELIC